MSLNYFYLPGHEVGEGFQILEATIGELPPASSAGSPSDLNSVYKITQNMLKLATIIKLINAHLRSHSGLQTGSDPACVRGEEPLQVGHSPLIAVSYPINDAKLAYALSAWLYLYKIKSTVSL